MDEATPCSPASIRTRQFVRAARMSGTGLGLGETPPDTEPLAFTSPEAEALDRAFVALVHAYIRDDTLACVELQYVLAEAGELSDAHAAVGLVLIERARRVLAGSDPARDSAYANDGVLPSGRAAQHRSRSAPVISREPPVTISPFKTKAPKL